MRKYLSILFRWNTMLMAAIQIWVLYLQQLTAVIAVIGGIKSSIYIIQHGENDNVKRIGRAVLLFLAIRSVGAIYSQDMGRAVQDIQFPLLGLIFFSFADWRRILGRKVLKQFEAVWFWAAVIAATVGIVKYAVGIESRIGPPFGATRPNFVHPDQPPLGSYSMLAKFLTMTILYFGAPLLVKINFHQIRLKIIGILALGVGLLLTFSRSCWMAFGVVSGMLTIKFNRRLFVILFIVGTSVIFILPYGRERVMQSFTSNQWATGRDILWKIAFERMDKQIIVGYGLGSFDSLISSEDRHKLSDQDAGDWHNQYIQLVMESGLIGLFAFVWLVIELFYGFFAALSRSTSDDLYRGALSGTALLMGALIFGMFETFLDSPVGNVTFWCLIGISVGWLRQIPQEKPI